MKDVAPREHGLQIKIIMPTRVPKYQSSAAVVVRALQLMFNSVSQDFRMPLSISLGEKQAWMKLNGKLEIKGFRVPILRRLKQLFQLEGTENALRPIIWVKTPKCAGTSLKQAIKNKGLPIDIIKWGLVSKFIENKSEYDFQNAYKFAVVRNPFDRFVSSYHYCIQNGWLDKSVQFKEFARISWEDIRNGPYPKGRVLPVNKVFQHTRPLVEHLSHDLGKCDYVDEFIHFENLEEELNDLLERFSMPPIRLPRLNTSTHRNYSGYYDEETRRYVAEKFREDLALFGYGFDSREPED